MSADRAEVLAWIDAEPGRGWRTAAREFGLRPDTVKSWCARRRGAPQAKTPERGAPRAAPVRPVAPATSAEPRKDGRRADGTFVPERERGREATREREPARAREPMAPALRRGFQAGIVHRVSFLARPESLHHKDAKSIALQLKLMVEAAPEAVGFAQDPEALRNAIDDTSLDAVFGKPAAQPLTAIEGGKAATG